MLDHLSHVAHQILALGGHKQRIRRGVDSDRQLALKRDGGALWIFLVSTFVEDVRRPGRRAIFLFGVLAQGFVIRAEQVIIPGGDTVIKPGDRIIIFGTRQAIPKIEKVLAVKLEYF